MRTFLFGLWIGMALAIGSAKGEGELHIYNWRNYTSPKLIEKFAKTYDINVILDVHETGDELLAAARADDSGYDIVVPAEPGVRLLIDEGRLAETRPSRMANFSNVDPRWIDVYWDPGRAYSAPNLWGTTALAIDTAVYGGDRDTLKLLFEPPPALRGKIGVVSESGDVIQAALRHLGRQQCGNSAADFEALRELLLNARRHWRTIAYVFGEGMISGDLALALTWNGDAMGVRLEKPTWTYVYPREGYTGWMDNIVVLKDAPNLENAKLFQNFMMAPENAALNSEWSGYGNIILGSEKFLPAGFADAPEMKLPAGAAPEFVPPCPSEVEDKYDAIWAEVTK